MPRVAIFDHDDFPTYGVSALLSVRRLILDLRAIGVEAEALGIDALRDPARFSATRFQALILPHGNTYPQDAFAHLRRFHQAGGSLITTGIPFTHGVVRAGARHWDATPEWGGSVRIDEGMVRITGLRSRWAGVSSARFAVSPGDRVQVQATITLVTQAPPVESHPDVLFVRFFDERGTFLGQEGKPLTAGPCRAEATAPARTAVADLSVQVWSASTYAVNGFRAERNGRTVALANGGLQEPGAGFADLGHRDAPARWGPQGIGVGGFAGPGTIPAPMTVPPGDPLHLKGIVTETRVPNPAPQWLDPASLPRGVTLVPALGTAARPLVALLEQKSGPFAGAVDAWTYRLNPGDQEAYETHQLLLRATLAVLGRRKALTPVQVAAGFRTLDGLPRPTRYAGVVLPTVPRRYDTFQPKLPPLARQLVVAEVARLSPEERVLLTCLQGLVNREQPRLYLIFDDDDRRWLAELQRQGEIDGVIEETNPLQLVTRFRSAFRGAVLCDPKISISPCIAVSLAGAENLLVVQTPALAARLTLPVVQDLRGRFKDNAAALRYLRTQLAPKLDPYLTCSLDPLVFDRGGLDHLVAAKASVFWITGPKSQHLPGANQAAELEELRAYFAALPLGAVVRGFWWHGDGVGLQESDGVALGSRFGKVTLVSDLISNLSVQSGVRARTLFQKPRPAPPPLDPSKVYVCFTMSDGDNLCTWRGYFRRYFDDPLRGTIPVGWGMAPTLIDLAPSWARWYYERATPNDEFLCDVSGVAYIYPPSWGTALKDRDAAFRWFYGRTQEYMERMDMQTIRLMDVRAQDIAQVGSLLPRTAYLLPDYGHAGSTRYSELTYTLPTGQPVFRAATSGSGPEHLAEQIRKHAGRVRPAFLNAFIWNWGSTLADLKRTLELLGSEYVAVTPSQLHALYRKSGTTPLPR